jgi:crotonobetainyl-CoA:carnitine CoA-transferase CaiB-like acyl-CoA transferase
MSADPTTGGPLTGIRVIDLTQMLAGPFCTMILADLGADVVKVEPPRGDLARWSPPFRADDETHAYGGYFASVNRNKRSLVLDLKRDDGAAALRALVARADVVVENFSAGVMERLGLAYESLAAVNPRLVYAAIRGFGDSRTGASPYQHWPAFDLVAQAMGGLLGITGVPGQPVKAGPGIGDLFPGALAALGVVAAVRHAERTGEGQFLDVAMYDAVLALCERIVYQHSYAGAVPGPEGNAHPLLFPFDVFAARDGHVAITAVTDDHWTALCRAMARDDLAADPRFADPAGRRAAAPELRAIIAGWTAARTKREVMAALAPAVPAGPLHDVADIFADPHVRARDMLVELAVPGSTTPATFAGIPIKLALTPGSIRRAAPALGEHTGEILAELATPPTSSRT